MNVEEIQYAVKNRIGLPPDEINQTLLRAAGLHNRVFLLPEQFNEKASYMADVLVQMLGFGSPIKGDLRVVSGILCQALSYLVNSTSWRDGEMHDFDLDEIRRKVRPLVQSNRPETDSDPTDQVNH